MRLRGEVLGDAAMCLIRGRGCRHNLLTLACPGRLRGSSSLRRDAGELSLLNGRSAPLPRARIAEVRHRPMVPNPSRDHFVWPATATMHPSDFPLGLGSGVAVDTCVLPTPL